jgi:hypothetical protein
VTAFNQVHLDNFFKLSLAPSEDGKIAEAWEGKAPGPWLHAVGYNSTSVEALEPRKKLKRGDVDDIVRRESVSDADASVLVFAWGGMTVKNAKSVINSKDHWLGIVAELRRGRITYLDAYERFYEQSRKGHMPGCGPAYYTKLIFFFTKHLDERGFIMDQWLGRSINLLADREIVLFTRDRRKMPLKQRYVSKGNSTAIYAEFCKAISDLARLRVEAIADIRGEQESIEMRLFSEGRGKGVGENM